MVKLFVLRNVRLYCDRKARQFFFFTKIKVQKFSRSFHQLFQVVSESKFYLFKKSERSRLSDFSKP